jgi:hypothetical protein
MSVNVDATGLGNVEILPRTATVDQGASLNDAAGVTVAVPVQDAAIGDGVILCPGADLLDVVVTGYVASAGSVEIRFQNESGGARDIPAATWTILLVKVGQI